MHTGTVDLRLPSLREDPFSQGPLSAKDSNLLVGRHSYFEEMEKNIQFKSSRRILLVGQYGSGKTSFVNCLGGKTIETTIERDKKGGFVVLPSTYRSMRWISAKFCERSGNGPT